MNAILRFRGRAWIQDGLSKLGSDSAATALVKNSNVVSMFDAPHKLRTTDLSNPVFLPVDLHALKLQSVHLLFLVI
jgi:hypothetical protein